MYKHQGFTLIELMMAVIIVGVLVAVAVPSFDNTMKKNRVETQLREFASHLKLARSESVSVQRPITICHLDSAFTCDGQWSTGWTVFFDDDRDGILETPATDTVKVSTGVGNNVLRVLDNTNTAQNLLRFDARGVANTAATISLCDASRDLFYARAILLSLAGMAMNSRAGVNSVHDDIGGVDLQC